MDVMEKLTIVQRRIKFWKCLLLLPPLLVTPRKSNNLKFCSKFMSTLTNLNSPLSSRATLLISSVIWTSFRVRRRTLGDFSNPSNIVLAFSVLNLIISGSEFIDMKLWRFWVVISPAVKILKPSSKFLRITTAEFSLTLGWTNQTFISTWTLKKILHLRIWLKSVELELWNIKFDLFLKSWNICSDFVIPKESFILLSANSVNTSASFMPRSLKRPITATFDWNKLNIFLLLGSNTVMRRRQDFIFPEPLKIFSCPGWQNY